MYRIGIGPDLVDRQVRAQRQNRDAVRILIVEIVVVTAVADVERRVVEVSLPSAYNIAALSGQVDRAKPGTARAGQRQPVRDVDIELVDDRFSVPS